MRIKRGLIALDSGVFALGLTKFVTMRILSDIANALCDDNISRAGQVAFNAENAFGAYAEPLPIKWFGYDYSFTALIGVGLTTAALLILSIINWRWLRNSLVK